MKKGLREFIFSLAVLVVACMISVWRNDKLEAHLDKEKQSVEAEVIALDTSHTNTELNKEKAKVALTFDDGPCVAYTEELLDGLKDRGVKATFFLIGNKIEACEDVVKRMHDEGHLIGNHSYDHVNLYQLSVDDAVAQIAKTNQVIREVTGYTPEYLRPPFGTERSNLDEDMGMIEVLWDVDPRDWCVQNTWEIVDSVVSKVQENDIILLHDGYSTSLAAAFEIIDRLSQQGYEFVTVDELLFE